MKKIIITTTTIAIIIILIKSYILKVDEEVEKQWVNLQLSMEEDIAFNDLYTNKAIYAFNEKHPKFYLNLRNKYGLMKNDSIIISTLFTDYKGFYYYLYTKGIISKKELIKKRIDSSIESRKVIKKPYSIAIEFLKNKERITFDENKNNNFLDDRAVLFDKDSVTKGNISNITRTLPIFNYNESGTINQNRKIIIYPSLNDQLFRPTDNYITKNSRLIVKFRDYWKGDLILNKNKYNFVIQGLYKSFLTVLIKPDSIQFSKNNYVFNGNFSYNIKDTIILANNIFIIDSVSDNISKLFLKKINLSRRLYGYRMGQKIKNYKLKDLNNQELQIYNLCSKSKYTLLDFWGVWCKPCKELTPFLKKNKNQYSNKLKVIGIAYGNNIEEVEKYVKLNDMNWTQTFVGNSTKNNIIKDLKIKQYPTFILLDSLQNIIYRNSGKDALIEVINLIK